MKKKYQQAGTTQVYMQPESEHEERKTRFTEK
jgi:hypothetical protein